LEADGLGGQDGGISRRTHKRTPEERKKDIKMPEVQRMKNSKRPGVQEEEVKTITNTTQAIPVVKVEKQ